MTAARRIVLVPEKGCEPGGDPVASALRGAGHEVALLPGVVELRAWLGERNAEVAVIRVATAEGDARPRELGDLQGEMARRGAHLLVLARGTGTHSSGVLLGECRLRHVLGVAPGEVPDAIDLTVTVDKLMTSAKIFGPERYLDADRTIEECRFEVRSSRDKERIVSEVEGFAKACRCHPLVAQAAGTAVDELVSNAVYDAPVDARGAFRYAATAREVPVTLAVGEEVQVSVSCDGARLAVAVTDPFGSLEPAVVLENLARCFARGPGQVDAKAGGAGVGLYHVFSLAHHLVINLAPGKRTEMIALFSVTRSYRAYWARPRSFNLFVAQ